MTFLDSDFCRIHTQDRVEHADEDCSEFLAVRHRVDERHISCGDWATVGILADNLSRVVYRNGAVQVWSGIGIQ